MSSSDRAEREIRACLGSLEILLARARLLSEEYDRRVRRVEIERARRAGDLEHTINFSELRSLDLLCKDAIARALPEYPDLADTWHVYEVKASDSPEHVVANLVSKKTQLVHALSLLGVDARTASYVSAERLRELRQCSVERFDLSKLVALCEEINIAYSEGLILTCGVLNRAILDHVPTIFGLSNFSDVATRHPGGRSFRDAMRSLDQSSRKIADAILHTQARSRESLPTAVQVDFRQSLDMLLQEAELLSRTAHFPVRPLGLLEIAMGQFRTMTVEELKPAGRVLAHLALLASIQC